MKKLGMFLLACVLSVSLVGCGNSNEGSTTSGNNEISGEVALDGSTSMEKMMTLYYKKLLRNLIQI